MSGSKDSPAAQTLRDARALYDLGVSLRSGENGPARDPAAAFSHFQAAAVKAGLPQAYIALGEMYLSGEGVERNTKEAANSFARAVNAGDPSGNLKLAEMYRDGNGVPRNDRMAFRFTAVAAVAGQAEGHFRLGRLFEEGIGTPVRSDAAAEQYRLAAGQGHADARKKLQASVLRGPVHTPASP